MRYLSDFAAGQVFTAGPLEVDLEQIQAFSRRYDPQSFHLDPAAAEGSFFDGLAASGWMTAALTMRLLLMCGLDVAWGLIGREVESLVWPRPVRAGDALSLTCRILGTAQPLAHLGTVRMRVETRNQKGQTVQRMTSKVVVPTRDTALLEAAHG